MGVNDLFKSKTDKEIEMILKTLSGEQLIKIGIDINDNEMIKAGIEKTGTKVWAFQYNASSADFFDNMINLKYLYELIEIQKEKRENHVNEFRYYVILKNIMVENEYIYSIKYFVGEYKPIYKDNKHINIMSNVIDKTKKLF